MDIQDLEKRLLNDFQRDLPLEPRPFLAMAERLGVTEDEVLSALGDLRDTGAISRVGAVIRPNSVGASTLAAMAVPPQDLERVAALVSAHAAVNHNYEREHRLNLWFVVTAPDADGVAAVLDDISERTGLAVLDLPMLEGYHLDLGFALQWT